MDASTVIGAIGLVLGAGGITALVQARSINRKVNAEADVTLGTGWQVLWESARKDNNELRERVAIVEKAEEECRARLQKIEGVDTPHMEKAVTALIEKEIIRRGGIDDRRRQSASTD